MTNWRFDLRSGCDSDDDENTDALCKGELACTADDELRGLFGSEKDDGVEYRPNPWSTAKINANARKAARFKETDNGLRSEMENRKARTRTSKLMLVDPGRVTTSSIKNTPGLKPRISLKESISSALRRESVLQTKPPDYSTLPSSRSDVQKSPYTETFTYQSHSRFPSLNEPGHDHASCEHKIGAYMPQDIVAIPQTSFSVTFRTPDTGSYSSGKSDLDQLLGHQMGLLIHILESEFDEESTPTLTWTDPSSDDPIFSTEDLSPFEFRPGKELYDGPHTESTADNVPSFPFRDPFSPDFSPPQPTCSREDIRPVDPRPYPMLGKSAAVPRSNLEPVFPSARRATQSQLVHHNPMQNRDLKTEIHSLDTCAIPQACHEPITPRKPTHRETAWYDPDEAPTWSTLPSRAKKSKRVKTPVVTPRFRLPSTFLGSSPIPGQSSKRLYKPPPRKRSLVEDQEQARWKVTRIG